MKSFHLLSLSLALSLSLSNFSAAQTIVGISPAGTAEAMEVQPALEAPLMELVDAAAFACLAKGERQEIAYDRLTKRVRYAFTMKNLDAKRALVAGVVVRSIYTRPRQADGPEVDSAAHRIRLAPGETKVLSGELAWDAPEGSLPKLVLPDPILHAEQVLRAQFEAEGPVPNELIAPAGGAIEATAVPIDGEAFEQLSIGRESVAWNRRDRTVTFTMVLRNHDAKRDLVVGVTAKTMSTRRQSASGPETDSIGFRVKIPAGEARVIQGTLAWDDLGGAAVPRLALPGKELHKEQILRAEFGGYEPVP